MAVGSLSKPHQTFFMFSGFVAVEMPLDAPVKDLPLTPQMVAETLPAASAAVAGSSQTLTCLPVLFCLMQSHGATPLTTSNDAVLALQP